MQELEIIMRIMPALAAVILVMITRRPIFSLAAGCLSGMILISNSFSGFLSNLYLITANILTDSWNLRLILALLILGAFIGVVKRSLHKKEIESRLLNSKKKVLAMGWFTGIFMFIDDYFNILLNGILLGSFANKHNVSREKLAFIIHSLGVSACVLIPFSTWSIYIIGLMRDIGFGSKSIEVFIGSIPFNFYSIMLILMTLAVIVFELDILKMKTAEKRMLAGDSIIDPQKVSMTTIMLPSLVLMGTSLLLILVNMRFRLNLESLFELDFINILLIASSVALIFGSVYYVAKGLLQKEDLLKSGYSGSVKMLSVLTILLLAWFLGAISRELGTTEAIVRIVEPYISISTLLVLTFVVTSVISFMTSSWATFAIMIPMILPLSMQIGINPSLALAAIISGGVFGDHTSPISSTTILTTAVSKIGINDHFHTQLPYSMIAFCISGYLFFLIGGL